MNIRINGEQQVVPDAPVSIAELLTLKDVEQPDMVSVQLNGQFVDRKEFPTTILKENDEVEFLYFMGGGSA